MNFKKTIKQKGFSKPILIISEFGDSWVSTNGTQVVY